MRRLSMKEFESVEIIVDGDEVVFIQEPVFIEEEEEEKPLR
jgi:hypothetical protein